MVDAIEGFECYNRRVRQPLADAAPAQGRLMLGTVRSHDQWNTTIYSDDDRLPSSC